MTTAATFSTHSTQNVAHSAPSSPDRLRTIIVSLFLFITTFALFSPSIQNGFLDDDDPGYVTHNHHIQHGFTWPTIRWAFTTGYAANYHPLTWLSHTLDWSLFGSDPRGHHLTNVLFHSLSAAVAFLAFKKLTRAFWTSAILAALFAWHPLRVESVAWIAERKDVLSVFFGLLTLWSYAAYAQKRRDHLNAIAPYILTFLFLTLGLLCKPTLVTIPCLLLVLDFWPLQRFPHLGFPHPQSLLWLLVEKIPLFLLAAASSIITYRVQKAGGAMMLKLPISTRLANVTVTIVRYLGKFFWPFNLAACYPYPPYWPRSLVAACLLLILLITAGAVLQFRRRPWILAGWLWYLGTLVPVVGIVQVGLQSMADRYTYLPLLGIEIAVLFTLRQIRLPASSLPWLKPAAVTVLLTATAARALDQLSYWQTPKKLYEHTLAVSTGNYMGECFLASVFFGQNDLPHAREHFERAIEFKPTYTVAQYRLGLILDKEGNHAAAMSKFRLVLKLDPADPKAHYSLGVDLLTHNQPAAAIPYFQAALQDPDDFNNSDTYLALGMAYFRLHDPSKSQSAYEQALALNPSNAEAHYDFANALASQNQAAAAIAEYQAATQSDPTFAAAYRNEANLLRKLNRPADAVTQYGRALAVDPQNPDALFGLGSALQDLGFPDQAAQAYEQAIQLRPNFPDAQYNLGVLYLNAGHPDLALPYFQAAAAAQPNNPDAHAAIGICESQLGNPIPATKP